MRALVCQANDVLYEVVNEKSGRLFGITAQDLKGFVLNCQVLCEVADLSQACDCWIRAFKPHLASALVIADPLAVLVLIGGPILILNLFVRINRHIV